MSDSDQHSMLPRRVPSRMRYQIYYLACCNSGVLHYAAEDHLLNCLLDSLSLSLFSFSLSHWVWIFFLAQQLGLDLLGPASQGHSLAKSRTTVCYSNHLRKLERSTRIETKSAKVFVRLYDISYLTHILVIVAFFFLNMSH